MKTTRLTKKYSTERKKVAEIAKLTKKHHNERRKAVPITKYAKTDSNELGLAAFGSSGPWEIAIDQTTSGDEKWFAQIEGPTLYLYFEITSPEIINQVLDFLKPPKAKTVTGLVVLDSLQLGTSERTLLTLIRDTEYEDRFFVNIGTPAGLLGSLTISDPDLSHLVQALHSVKEDLAD